MKKQILSILLMYCCSIASAQIQISCQLTPGTTNREQLWNILLFSPHVNAQEFVMKITIQDAESGNIMMSGTSGRFLLSKGSRFIRLQELQPIEYNISNAAFSNPRLPIGKFVVCYEVLTVKDLILSARECINFNVEPLSPPLLNYPSDKEEITTAFPLLNWFPPAPVSGQIMYDLRVCEIENGQNAAEAIDMNTPVFFKESISTPFSLMPTSSKGLEVGKKYAWQVRAYNQNSYSGKSQTWEFNFKQDSVERIVSLAPFILMSKNSSEISIAHQGFLKLEILNTSTDTTADLIVKNTRSENSVEIKIQVPIKSGQNFLTYDMNKHRRLNKDDVYLVEHTNSINEKYSIRFMPVYYR